MSAIVYPEETPDNVQESASIRALLIQQTLPVPRHFPFGAGAGGDGGANSGPFIICSVS